ncbi:MAG: phosphoenolpyruvate carboxykinase (ATP) [SAR324 cluster bacterium]|nr:phosphoenolpyruvate carboxykinase (ATP) [SAR324 cluster bacterium]
MSISTLGLEKVGITEPGQVFHNLSYDQLYEHEIRNHEGQLSSLGAINVDTGRFTGRSPKDKYFVDEPSSNENIWWGKVNKKVSEEIFNELWETAKKQLNGKDLYVTDGLCGANANEQMKIRVVSEIAWQAHFVKNMFIRPEKSELEGFEPEFTILNACKTSDAKWNEHGLNSEVFVIFHLKKKMAIIGGTWYGGEMKKGVFSVMNYVLPLKGIASMHCSANVGKEGDTALFFGLSGTGKTTLSTDPHRQLIGDDEHGWGDDGIFNFEGGCYAKCIDLDPEKEPEIYQAIRRDALLENISFKDGTNEVNFADDSKTENTRVSYPIYHIDNIVPPPSIGGHPRNIIFLTCDAFGVLPPVAKLTPEQAMYHFLSGYTAKVAGTERGVTEPQATFSACFGQAFLTLHPTVYARLLGAKIRQHKVNTYLVNTGWSGGPYGVGKRMDLPVTRKILDGIFDGSIETAEFVSDPIFQILVPQTVNGIDPTILNPRNTWSDQASYTETAEKLAGMMIENFKQYTEQSSEFDFAAHGPKHSA